MSNHYLIVSTSVEWLTGTQLALQEQAPQKLTGDSVPPRLSIARTEATARAVIQRNSIDPITAVIIDGFFSETAKDAASGIVGYGADRLCHRLRKSFPSLAIIFAAPVSIDLLRFYAESNENSECITDISPSVVWNALNRAKKFAAAPQPWAQVDFTIGVASINVHIRLANGEVLCDSAVPSSILPFLKFEQQAFGAQWELYVFDATAAEPRVHDSWPEYFKLLGDMLHHCLIIEPQSTAIQMCLDRVESMDNVYFRFVTDSFAFPDVPFEALRYGEEKKFFVRDFAPVARRILVRPSERVSSPSLEKKPPPESLTGRMLIIESSTGTGVLRVGKRRFHGNNIAKFNRPNLGADIQKLKTRRETHRCGQTELCKLESGQDALDVLRGWIKRGPWDIVHFSGHSIRSDDGEVFLVLPSTRPGSLIGLSVLQFAGMLEAAHAKLLVLASCEGASSGSLFRLAQVGIPAVVGFRWEVKSNEANDFSIELHDKLADGVSLGKAYHHAVHTLGEDRPAFLSSMLVVQDETWANI